MKKLAIGAGAFVFAVVVVIVAVPIASANSWRNDTATDMTEMLSFTANNLEETIVFLETSDPDNAVYRSELERLDSSISSVEETLVEIDDLGPNLLDVTGQYASTEELHHSLSAALESMKANYEEQRAVVSDQQQDGLSIENATEYRDASAALSDDFAEVQTLVGQL